MTTHPQPDLRRGSYADGQSVRPAEPRPEGRFSTGQEGATPRPSRRHIRLQRPHREAGGRRE